MKQIDLTAAGFGTSLADAGFRRISARRYLRITPGDIAQRIELRPNRHGGELTCDLTLHPLYARERVPLDVLEPGVWIKTLCTHYGGEAPRWFARSEPGIQEMVDLITTYGLPWFDANSTAEGIIRSAEDFSEPWLNEPFVHVELGHCYLRAGHLAEALRVFDRKPSRVPRYKSLAAWIAAGDTGQIAALHSAWMESARSELPG